MTDLEETAETYDPSRYERPSITVDVVIFTLIDRELHVLLVRRKRWPYEGYWAIPRRLRADARVARRCRATRT